MTRKRGNNEGSIHRRESGTWRAQVTLEGRRLSHTANTRRECQDWIRETLGQIDYGLTFASTQITFEDYLEKKENRTKLMEFIGEKGNASKTLKEIGVKNLEQAYVQIVEFIARSFYISHLVHADLSEYNILVKNFEGKEKLIVIDVGQAVLKSHPKAEEFLERDLKNISNYFTKKGFEKSEV